jgi:predicted nuclease of predicted toxin-antitoxin system
LSSATRVRLILDQGIPRDAAAFLRKRGHDCIHAGEMGMATATDEEIIAWSVKQRGIIVTLDADFHAILAVSRAIGPSVVRIRMQGLGALAVVELVERIIARFADELSGGSLVTVKPNKTTCHKLPIGGAE